MLIIPYVCAEFRDSKGNTLFTIRPDMLKVLQEEVPESIRQDPLFDMLVRDGSIKTPETAVEKKLLEQDPMAGMTAEGRRIVDAGGVSEGDSEVSRNKRSPQCGAFSRPLPVADEGRGNVDKLIEAADKKEKAKSSRAKGKQETPSDDKVPGQPESGEKEAGTEEKPPGINPMAGVKRKREERSHSNDTGGIHRILSTVRQLHSRCCDDDLHPAG